MAAILMPADIGAVRPGTWKVIEPSGEVRVVETMPTLASIKAAIGATTLDIVSVRLDPMDWTESPEKRRQIDRRNPVVMFIDDIGHAKLSRRNEVATRIYLAQCHPGTDHYIAGTVVLVNDNDFG